MNKNNSQKKMSSKNILKKEFNILKILIYKLTNQLRHFEILKNLKLLKKNIKVFIKNTNKENLKKCLYISEKNCCELDFLLKNKTLLSTLSLVYPLVWFFKKQNFFYFS